MVEWLNVNQGFALCILTAFYVIFTGWIIWEMRRERKERTQPNVIARIPPKVVGGTPIVELVIKNIGNGIAKNISISFDQNIKDYKGRNLKELDFIRDYPSLAPNEELPHFINVGFKFFKENKITAITGEIHFEDIYGKKRTNPIEIKVFKDIASVSGKTMDHLVREVEKLVKIVGTIAKQSGTGK